MYFIFLIKYRISCKADSVVSMVEDIISGLISERLIEKGSRVYIAELYRIEKDRLAQVERARIKAEEDAMQAIINERQNYINKVVSMQRRYRLNRYYKTHVKGRRMRDIEDSHNKVRQNKVSILK